MNQSELNKLADLAESALEIKHGIIRLKEENEELKEQIQTLKRMIPVVFQCCHCRLPERGPNERVSHGICDPCMEIHHPGMLEQIAREKENTDG